MSAGLTELALKALLLVILVVCTASRDSSQWNITSSVIDVRVPSILREVLKVTLAQPLMILSLYVDK